MWKDSNWSIFKDRQLPASFSESYNNPRLRHTAKNGKFISTNQYYELNQLSISHIFQAIMINALQIGVFIEVIIQHINDEFYSKRKFYNKCNLLLN